ncbi:MAG: hypothetical protein M3P82_02780, partial [Bacteroidota bacterium]|nr:hypothetical protein [Bacteroidota bacterium]
MPGINFLKKYEKYIYIFSCVALFLFSSIVIIKSVNTHYKYIAHPYQLEYREGAALNITQLFLNKRNPFSIEEQPQNTYVYGLAYPLTVTPFAKSFGNTLFVHRSFVYFFICATCLLVFYVLIKKKVNFVFAFAAIIILHQSIINAANTAVARPEGLGIFLFTLGIIIAWRWNFSNASLAVSIILGVLGYLTKPYYVFVIPIIAAYLFIFVSKRKSLAYTIVSLLFLLVMIGITAFVFPLYINNTLANHFTDSLYNYNHMKDQVAEYTEIYIFLILIIFLSFILIFRKFLQRHLSKSVDQLLEHIRNLFQVNFNFKISRDEPLIKTRFNFLFAFSLLIVFILFVVKLGGNVGNYHASYLFHLASAMLIIVTFLLLNKTLNKLYHSFAAILLIITMNIEFKTPEYDFVTFASCFKQMDELIQKSNNTFNSPENVSIMIQQNKPVYNSGHSEYFSGELDKSHLTSSGNDEVTKRRKKFQREVDDKIIRKEFDLILLTRNYYNYFVNDN